MSLDNWTAHRARIDGKKAKAALNGSLGAGSQDCRIKPSVTKFRHGRSAPKSGKLALRMKIDPAGTGGYPFDVSCIHAEVARDIQIAAQPISDPTEVLTPDLLFDLDHILQLILMCNLAHIRSDWLQQGWRCLAQFQDHNGFRIF